MAGKIKIAVAVDNGTVAEHFGRCKGYKIFTFENGALCNKEYLANPGHKPFFLPKFLAEKNVDVVLCKGIGPKALALFESLSIKVVYGLDGRAEELAKKFIRGEISRSKNICEHME